MELIGKLLNKTVITYSIRKKTVIIIYQSSRKKTLSFAFESSTPQKAKSSNMKKKKI